MFKVDSLSPSQDTVTMKDSSGSSVKDILSCCQCSSAVMTPQDGRRPENVIYDKVFATCITTENNRPSCFNRDNIRPPYSYISMIAMAIENSPDRR